MYLLFAAGEYPLATALGYNEPNVLRVNGLRVSGYPTTDSDGQAVAGQVPV